jgi:putative ABC transport system permease protein
MTFLLRLSLNNLFAQRARSILAFIGIVLGVAIIFAESLGTKAAHQNFIEMVEKVSGQARLEVKARSPLGFSKTTLQKIERVKGVKKAFPSVKGLTLATVGGDEVEIMLMGIDPEIDHLLRRYQLKKGRFLPKNRTGYALLTEDFAREHKFTIGDRLPILTVNGVKKLKVAGIIAKLGVASAREGQIVFTDLGTGQRVFNLKGIQIADLQLNKGAEVTSIKKELEEALGDKLEVYRPASRKQEVEDLLSSMERALSFFSLIAIFVGSFIIFDTFLVSVARRTREFGALRSIGVTKAQIIAMILSEALLLGIWGSLCGLLLGYWVSGFIVRALANIIHTPLGYVKVSFSSLIMAFSLGLSVTVLSALYPALRASRVSPLEAVRQVFIERSRWFERFGWIIGSFLIAIALVLIFSSSGSKKITFYQLSSFPLLLGTTFVLPLLIGPLLLFLQKLLAPIFGSEGKMAVANAGRNKGRTALTVMALAIGLMMIIGIESMNESYQKSIRQWIDTAIGADLFLQTKMSLGSEIGEVLPMKYSLIKRIKRVKGVRYVSPIKFLKTEVKDGKDEKILVVVVDQRKFDKVSETQFVEGKEQEAKRALARGGSVFISTALAQRHKFSVGDRVTLKTPKGAKKFKIVAIVVDYSHEKGTVRINWSDYQRFFGSNTVDSFDIKVRDGMDIAEVKADLKKRVADKLNLKVVSAQEFKREVELEIKRVFALLDAIVLISLVIGALAVINTISISVIERRRELGVLRAIGFTKGQIARFILTEGGIIGLIGGLIGALAGLFIAYLMLEASVADTGYPLQLVVPMKLILMTGFAGVFVSLLATLYPAWQASSVNIVQAVHFE